MTRTTCSSRLSPGRAIPRTILLVSEGLGLANHIAAVYRATAAVRRANQMMRVWNPENTTVYECQYYDVPMPERPQGRYPRGRRRKQRPAYNGDVYMHFSSYAGNAEPGSMKIPLPGHQPTVQQGASNSNGVIFQGWPSGDEQHHRRHQQHHPARRVALRQAPVLLGSVALVVWHIPAMPPSPRPT